MIPAARPPPAPDAGALLADFPPCRRHARASAWARLRRRFPASFLPTFHKPEHFKVKTMQLTRTLTSLFAAAGLVAAVPWIIRNGGQAYLEVGKPNNGGTKLFSISGDVERPGNYEIPMGTP
ncbi:SLBB domain protein, partial [Bordetella bronchiseptica 980]